MAFKITIHIPYTVTGVIIGHVPGTPYTSSYCLYRVATFLSNSHAVVTLDKKRVQVYLINESWYVDNGVPFQLSDRLVHGDMRFYTFIGGKLTVYTQP